MVIAFRGFVQSYGIWFWINEYAYIFIPVYWVCEAKSHDQSSRNIANCKSYLEFCKLSGEKKNTLDITGVSIQGNEAVSYSLLVHLFLKEVSECFSKEVFKMKKTELQDS